MIDTIIHVRTLAWVLDEDKKKEENRDNKIE